MKQASKLQHSAVSTFPDYMALAPGHAQGSGENYARRHRWWDPTDLQLTSPI
jgi:hypothetical protein